MRGNVVELVIIHYINKSIASNRAMLFTPIFNIIILLMYTIALSIDYEVGSGTDI
jgi:hypothetical protein